MVIDGIYMLIEVNFNYVIFFNISAFLFLSLFQRKKKITIDEGIVYHSPEYYNPDFYQQLYHNQISEESAEKNRKSGKHIKQKITRKKRNKKKMITYLIILTFIIIVFNFFYRDELIIKCREMRSPNLKV